MQAWPSLAKGPLGHLWEAGLDPLDPMFLANINDPTAFAVCSAVFPSLHLCLYHGQASTDQPQGLKDVRSAYPVCADWHVYAGMSDMARESAHDPPPLCL